MIKEGKDNSCGVTAVILGILSILLAGINGVILAITALIFASKQKQKQDNIWARRGKILAIIGIILSVALLVLLAWLSKHPEILAEYTPQYLPQ